MYKIEKTNEKNVRKHILWVGRLIRMKQPELFIKLAEQFSDEKFLMIAPGYNDNFEKEVQVKINRVKNIKRISYVKFSDIDDYFKQAKILISSSTYEGFPNTFVQAAKNGTPIITYSTNPEDILNRYHIGFCANKSFEQMTRQLNRLLNDKKLWEERSKKAYKYAQEKHDIKKNVEELKKLLESQ